MRKLLTLAGAVAGAAVLSQYPAFSQQYLQRLAGQVDALSVVVMDFEASALEQGLGREAALAQMTGTAFLDARATDMRRTFARHARLSDDLMALRAASPLQKITMPHRTADPATLRATWADFEPALPLSAPGAVSAGAGFLGGWLLSAGGLALLLAPFGRRRRAARRDTRVEPAVQRSPAATAPHIPRLDGVRR